jgi:hypothetical protein
MDLYIDEAKKILQTYGEGYPYGKFENASRKVLASILGERIFFIDQLPSWLVSSSGLFSCLYLSHPLILVS